MKFSEQLMVIVNEANSEVDAIKPKNSTTLGKAAVIQARALDKVRFVAQSMAQREAQGDGWLPFTSETELPTDAIILFWKPEEKGASPLLGFEKVVTASWNPREELQPEALGIGDGWQTSDHGELLNRFNLDPEYSEFTHYRVVRGPEAT